MPNEIKPVIVQDDGINRSIKPVIVADDGINKLKKKEVSQSTPKQKVTSSVTSKTEEQKRSESLSSANRWSNVTEPKPVPSKYKTDDYIDVLENKPLKKKKVVTVQPDKYAPEVKVTEIDAPTEKEAEIMMEEDFGRKEFDAYQNINKIDKNIAFKTEDEAVKELRERFKGSGFIFETTGVGNKIKISTSTNGGLTTINSKEFDLIPSTLYGQSQTGMPVAQTEDLNRISNDKYNEIVDFMSKSILKKTDKDFLKKEVKDYGQLVNLMADNPYKYGEEFLNQYDTDRWFDNQYRDLVIESKSLKRDEDQLLAQYDEFVKNPTSIEQEAELKNKINSLDERKNILKSKYDDLGRLNNKLKVSSAVYYKNKEKQGNTAGLISKSFIKGAFNMEKALSGIAADVMPYVLPEGSLMPDVQREKLKASGMSDNEIKDYASKQLRKQIVPQIEKGLTDLVSFGTTDEYIQSKDRGDLEKVASFLSESIGTAISAGGNPALQKVAFFSQSYNAIEDEMNSSQFDGLNQFEKKLISVPYAMTIGALENLGFKFATGTTKNPIFNKLVNNIVFRTFSNLPKNASATLMQNELKRNTAAMLANAGLRIVGGAFVESAVEGTQQLDEIAIKNISNAITDKDYFQDVPDITTADGINKAIGAAATDAYYGFLGGLIMSSGSESISAIRDGYSNKKSDDDFAVFSNSLKDNNLRSSIESDIKSKIVSGDITKEEAKAQIESMNKSYSILKSIPDNLSLRDQRDSFNLILEKQKIQKETEGKDPALVAAQTDRVNEINEELKTISKNAVQVETTGEVPVQPGAEVGREMEEGESQTEPQVVAEEGQVSAEEEVKVFEFNGKKYEVTNESTTDLETGNLVPIDLATQILEEGTPIEETVVVEPITKQEQQQNLVTQENVDELRSQQTTPVAQKIYTTAKLAMKALPGVKIYVHNSTNEFNQAIGQKSAEGAKGAYVDGEVHINLENGADVVTMLHESMHHGLVVKGVESGAMIDLARGLKSVISDKALNQRLDDFISNYDGSEQAEEYLAELGGIMAEAQQELTTTKFQQFKNLINKLAQKLGLPIIFSEAANAKNAVDFMNSLTKSIRTGQEIKSEEVKKTGKVKFQADFSDPLSKLTFVYDKNGEKFDQLKKDGFITDDKVLSDFAGKFIFLHQPDAAFSGMIYKDGEILVEGKGGVFYPIKFHDDGYFWASTANTAEKMAKDLNKVFDQNDGTIYMALTSAPYDKLMSSTTMSNAILDFFSSKAFDNNFKINPTQLRVALRKAANNIKIQKTKDPKTGKIKEKKIGLDLKIKADTSLNDIQSQIKTALNPDEKSFADRKNFAEELIKLMAENIKNNPKATEQFGKLFSEGIQNKYFKGISKTGKLSISTANMTQAISEMFTEPLLKEDIDREKGGQVYAIVELNGKVEPVDSDKHESYPKAIQSEDKNNKVKIHILQDRKNWAESFIDPETGESVSEDRQKKLFPTSGVSVMGLQLKGESKVKFQKANTQQEAIQKAKEKYTLSVEERGNPHKQGVDAALSDLRKSDWYNTSDDTQRENAERELKEFFGEKLKKAPSVAKILGKPKPKKVTVNEMTAYKNELRLQAKAARDAKGDLNAKRRALATAISGMAKTGKIKTAQASVLIKRISNLNLDNPVMVERFVDYASKVFDRADYQQRLDDAFSVRKGIRKLLKTDNQAEVSGMAKAFTKIDPSMVEDIDAYIEMAEKVKNAVKPSRVKGLDVVMKEAANIAEISEYTNEEIARQDQIKKDELLATYDFLEVDMSLKDMQDVINALKDPTSQMDITEKEKYVKDYLNGRFGIMSSILELMFKTGIDPMTGEDITFDDKQKELIKRALKIDLNEMSVRDAIKIVESLENFITNQITSGLEAAVSSYEGAMNVKSLVNRGKKAKSLRLFFSNYVGKIYSEQLFSLPMLMEKMFGGVTNSLDVMNKMGLIKLINGVNKANRQHNDILDQYSKQEFYKSKGFMDAENVYERGMLAFLKRNLVGSPAEMKAEFERRVRMIQESINKLTEDGDPKEQKMGELYQKIYDKLGVSEMDMDVINANASKNNLDAVNWWVNQWSQHYSDLSDISLSVYNTQLGSDLNYTPDKYKKLSSENQSLDEGAVERNGAFAISIDYTDKNKTGVLMETTRPNAMPDGRYISLDFDTNNSKALKSALTDINTASAIRQVDGFINSKSFKKLIPESEDRSIMTKRINTYIRRAKGKSIVTSDTIQYLNKLVNFATALGVGKALGGINQAVSQTIPVMVNTIVNAGRFDFAGADFNTWLDKSGLPISNRGLESQSTVDSIDRKIDMKGTGVQEALKSVTDLNQWYLKQFLVRPDVFVARSSFKSYYLQNLKRRGLSTDIDWNTHEIDMDAAEYAQAMIDRQQNISDPMLAGEFLSSDDPIKQIARKVILPFASFILNQKARMYNDMMTISSKTTSRQDKIIAYRSLTGLATELATYQMIGFGIRRLYDMIAASLLGDEDDEETKKKKIINATKYPIKSIVNDIFSPIPMTDGITTWGLNQALAQYPWMTNKEIKDAIESRNKVLELKGESNMTEAEEKEFIAKIKEEATYQVFEDEFNRSYGMIGIAGSTYQELGEIGNLATTGEFTDEYQGIETTKKLLESDREKVKYAVPFMIAYSTGLLPKDVGSIGRNYVNRIKKKAITEKQFERYDAVQKDLGRNLKSWEVELVKAKKESETAVDEVKFIERNGGLTERQGREYLKLMKAIGEPSVSDIVRIKEGQTADQILK
jgi:hypothetical protein